MATKLQWVEVFRNYEASARGMVALRETLELRREENEQPTGLFSFARAAWRWFEINP
ncbi:MAG: hypothetical protein JO145_03100 [Acidobacteriaceae bacterium]|nr:hypothetical protein [Acidobacteriaceae bacterium]